MLYRAGAAIFPHPDAKGHALQVESFKYFWALAHRDPTSGVQVRTCVFLDKHKAVSILTNIIYKVVKATEYYDDRDDDSTIWYKSLVPQYRRIPTEDLPDGVKLGFTFKTMTVNPAIFLPWIKKGLEARGVRFIRKEVKDIEEAKHISGCRVVVHAPGLGASELVNDKDVVAVRGQTMFVETDFDELIMLQGSQYTYIIPRMYTGGAIIGGVSQEGNLDRGVDESLRSNILSRVRNLSRRRLGSVDLEKCSTRNIVAFRPARKGGYRLETEGNVVHAYGFGSLGYIYGYGAGLKVREFIESVSKGQDILRSRL